MAQVLGSTRAVGFGKESTKGTAVAPTFWHPQKEITVEDSIGRIMDDSGIGTRYGAFQGDTNREAAGGNVNGNIYPSIFGHLLLAAMGAVNTATHPTATGVKVHTFSVANDLPAYTIATKDDNESLRSAYGMLNSLELAFDQEDYARFTSSWLARRGASVANTPSFTQERGFRPQDVVIKIADTVAGLSGATALRVESGSLAINNNLITRGNLGTVMPDYYPGRVETGISLSRLYLGTDIKDMVFGTTQKAMSIKMTRSDVSIGTGTPTNPSLEFVFQPGFFSEWGREGGLEDLKDENISYQPLFSIASGKMFDAILTTTTASF